MSVAGRALVEQLDIRRQHQAGQLVPDLTARPLEADEITLKCKGDMTVSLEPDGSILGLARQTRSEQWFSSRDLLVFFTRFVSLSHTISGTFSMSRFLFLCSN